MRYEKIIVGAAWVLAAALVGACMVRWLGLDDSRRGVVVVTFLPWILLPVYFLVGLAHGLRRRGLLAVALVVAGYHVLIVGADLAWAPGSPDAPDGAPAVEVVAANVYFFNTDIVAAFDEVMSEAADVVVLSELRGPSRQRLAGHPITAAYPAQTQSDDVAILSALPMIEDGVVAGSDMPWARVVVDGIEVLVVGVHAVPATETERWERDYSALGAFVAARSEPVILAGDFNATAQHRPFRDLLDEGLTDAHKAAGRGWGATWPTNFPLGPQLRLDRVLVSDDAFVVTAYGDAETPGSDHKRVRAEIAVVGR